MPHSSSFPMPSTCPQASACGREREKGAGDGGSEGEEWRDGDEVEEGTVVKMLYDDGVWYKGWVEKVNQSTGMYVVAFPDGIYIYIHSQTSSI